VVSPIEAMIGAVVPSVFFSAILGDIPPPAPIGAESQCLAPTRASRPHGKHARRQRFSQGRGRTVTRA
jgi:hypothetical protein